MAVHPTAEEPPAVLTRRRTASLTIVLALFGAACGDDEPSAEPTTTVAPDATATPGPAEPVTADPTTGPTTTAAPDPTDAPTTAPVPTEAPTTTAAGADVELGEDVDRVIEIEVVDGQVVDGPRTEEVALGSTVALVVTADVDDEVHVHVYDIHGEARAGQTTATTFLADIPGVVEVELEDAGRLLVELEVS